LNDRPKSIELARREFTITRVFDAPRELVFKAWTEPAHFTHWWGARGFSAPLATISMDVRPGGEWRATMVSDDGRREVPFFGVYREVVEPERLVFTLVDPNDPQREARREGGVPEEEVVTVTFNDLGEKTEMVFHQVGYLPEELIPRSKEGWSSFFDRLAEYLAQARHGSRER
jgi:uncharacterized protein YndB with AHSA1/START domain